MPPVNSVKIFPVLLVGSNLKQSLKHQTNQFPEEARNIAASHLKPGRRNESRILYKSTISSSTTCIPRPSILCTMQQMSELIPLEEAWRLSPCRLNMECDACQANSSSFAGETNWSLSKKAGAKVANLFDATEDFQGIPFGVLQLGESSGGTTNTADNRWYIKFVLRRRWQARSNPLVSQHARQNSDAPVRLYTRRSCSGAHWIMQGVASGWLHWNHQQIAPIYKYWLQMLQVDGFIFLSFPPIFKYWRRQYGYATIFEEHQMLHQRY